MHTLRFASVLLCLLIASPVLAADAAPAKKVVVTGEVVTPPPAKVPPVASTPTSQPAAKPAAPAPAAPAAAPAADANPVEQVSAIVAAFKTEHVRAGIAGILCLLVWAWRRFASKLLIGKIPNKWLPLVTALVAFLAAIPTTLAATPWSWSTFLWQGLITGAEAMAFWSVLFKFVLPSVPEPKKE